MISSLKTTFHSSVPKTEPGGQLRFNWVVLVKVCPCTEIERLTRQETKRLYRLTGRLVSRRRRKRDLQDMESKVEEMSFETARTYFIWEAVTNWRKDMRICLVRSQIGGLCGRLGQRCRGEVCSSLGDRETPAINRRESTRSLGTC